MSEKVQKSFAVDVGKVRSHLLAGEYEEALKSFPGWIKDPLIKEIDESTRRDIAEQVAIFERVSAGDEEEFVADFAQEAVRKEIFSLLDFQESGGNTVPTKKDAYLAAAKLIADHVAYSRSVSQADISELNALEFEEDNPEEYEKAFRRFQEYQARVERGDVVEEDFTRWEPKVDEQPGDEKEVLIAEGVSKVQIDKYVDLAKEVFERKDPNIDAWLKEIETNRQVPIQPEFSATYFAQRKVLKFMSIDERDSLKAYFEKKERIRVGSGEKLNRSEIDLFNKFVMRCRKEVERYNNTQRSKEFGHLLEYVLLDILSLSSFMKARCFKRVLKSSPVEDFFRGSDLVIQASDDRTWISIDVTTGREKDREGATLPNLGAMIYDQNHPGSKTMDAARISFSESYSVMGIDYTLDKEVMFNIAREYIDAIKAGKCKGKAATDKTLLSIIEKNEFDYMAWGAEVERKLELSA